MNSDLFVKELGQKLAKMPNGLKKKRVSILKKIYVIDIDKLCEKSTVYIYARMFVWVVTVYATVYGAIFTALYFTGK